METAFLPNGTHTLFGSVSCMHHDSSGGASVLDMSGLNEFLINIHHGIFDSSHADLRDFIFVVNLQYIRTY